MPDESVGHAPEPEEYQFSLPDRGADGATVLWCASCLRRAFTHDPDDPHLHHGASCGVRVNRAMTVIDGEARCHECTIAVLFASLPS